MSPWFELIFWRTFGPCRYKRFTISRNPHGTPLAVPSCRCAGRPAKQHDPEQNSSGARRKKLASEYSVPCASKLERAELIRKNDLERVRRRRHVLGGGLRRWPWGPWGLARSILKQVWRWVYMHIKYLAAGTILSIDRINWSKWPEGCGRLSLLWVAMATNSISRRPFAARDSNQLQHHGPRGRLRPRRPDPCPPKRATFNYLPLSLTQPPINISCTNQSADKIELYSFCVCTSAGRQCSRQRLSSLTLIFIL